MRKLIVVLLFLLLAVDFAHADSFRLEHRTDRGDIFYVKQSPVRLFDANRRMIFEGYTDARGRIRISLGRGSYQGEVFFRGRNWRIEIEINNRQDLKHINVPVR